MSGTASMGNLISDQMPHPAAIAVSRTTNHRCRTENVRTRSIINDSFLPSACLLLNGHHASCLMVMVVAGFAFAQFRLEHKRPGRGDDLARVETEHDFRTLIVAAADHHLSLFEPFVGAHEEILLAIDRL